MENTSVQKESKAVSKETLQVQYMEYLLLNEKNPTSIFAFCRSLKLNESDFYEHYNSFKALEGDIWKSWFDETMEVLNNDKAYPPYSIREKLLAFYYTWIEIITKHRSFVLLKFGEMREANINPDFLLPFKEAFRVYVQELMTEGKDTTEVADRPFSNQYDKGFWIQFMFITRFWAKDDSKGFEKTDAIIEKMVNFSFDLVSKGPLDSFLDLAKFLYQNKKF